MMSNLTPEVLIDRVVSDDDAEAWAQIREHAAQEPQVWRELAESFRDQRALMALVDDAGDRAEATDAPVAGSRRLGLSGWSGWLVAAALLFAVTTGLWNPHAPVGLESNQAGLFTPVSGHTVQTPDEAIKAYLELGESDDRVIGELPDRYLLQARQLENGEYEVYYVRQFIERTHVPSLYEYQSRPATSSGASLANFTAPRHRGAM